MSWVLKQYFRRNRLALIERDKKRRFIAREGKHVVIRVDEDRKEHERVCELLKLKRELVVRHARPEKFVPPPCDAHYPTDSDGVRRRVKSGRQREWLVNGHRKKIPKASDDDGNGDDEDSDDLDEEAIRVHPEEYPSALELPPLDNKSSIFNVHDIFKKPKGGYQAQRPFRFCHCPGPTKEDIYDGLLIMVGHLLYMDPFSFEPRTHRKGSADPRVGHRGNRPRPLSPDPPYWKLLAGIPGWEDLGAPEMDEVPRFLQPDTALCGGLAFGSKMAAAQLLNVKDFKDEEGFWRETLRDYIDYLCCNIHNNLLLKQLRVEVFGDKNHLLFEYAYDPPLKKFVMMGEMGRVEVDEIVGAPDELLVESDDDSDDEDAAVMYERWKAGKTKEQLEEAKRFKQLQQMVIFEEREGVFRDGLRWHKERPYENVKYWLMEMDAMDKFYEEKRREYEALQRELQATRLSRAYSRLNSMGSTDVSSGTCSTLSQQSSNISRYLSHDELLTFFSVQSDDSSVGRSLPSRVWELMMKEDPQSE